MREGRYTKEKLDSRRSRDTLEEEQVIDLTKEREIVGKTWNQKLDKDIEFQKIIPTSTFDHFAIVLKLLGRLMQGQKAFQN